MLIGLTGYAGSGKDTAAKFLTDRGWTRVSFADPIREMALAIDPMIPYRHVGGETPRLSEWVNDVGWDTANRHAEVRRLLQRIGAEAGRSIFGEDCWLEIAARKCDMADGPVVITDCRFPNEAEFIRERGILVKVEREGVGPVNDHVSDADLPCDLIDYHLHNGGDVRELWDGLATIANSEWPVTGALPRAISDDNWEDTRGDIIGMISDVARYAREHAGFSDPFAMPTMGVPG